jgi:hypothetical protein
MIFKNGSGIEFTPINTELYRCYRFENGSVVRIEEPLFLNVSDSGGHRIFDNKNTSHYIPAGWIHLYWESKPGKPNFVK